MRWLAVVAILGGCDKLFGLTPLPGVDVAPPLAPVIEAIATGSHHACHIRNDGSLWCWGANNWGQLGVSSSEPHIGQPRQVDGSWDRVRSKWLHTCGIQRDNSLWCWGLNSQGQLGKEPVSPRQEIAPIQIAGVWKRVSPGVEHTCGVRADDDGVYCWGTNAFAQLGDGTLTPR